MGQIPTEAVGPAQPLPRAGAMDKVEAPRPPSTQGISTAGSCSHWQTVGPAWTRSGALITGLPTMGAEPASEQIPAALFPAGRQTRHRS